MKYEHAKILREWSILQLRIAQTKVADPVDRLSIDESNVHKSKGYRQAREFLARLSPRAREKAIAWMESHVRGVRELMARAAEAGEELSMADLTIEIKDRETGEPIGTALVTEPTMCRGAGAATMNLVAIDGNNRNYVKCPKCLQRWFAEDIGMSVPPHQPTTA